MSAILLHCPPPSLPSVVIPHESHPHSCTWMAYGVSTKIWGRRRLVEQVKGNLRRIAITIAQYNEIVHVLVRPVEYEQAVKEFESDIMIQSQQRPIPVIALHHHIILIPITSNLNDIWIRDTGPIFVHINDNSDDSHMANSTTTRTTTGAHSSSNIPKLGAVSGNFNGWGNKQPHQYDQHVAEFIRQYINQNKGNLTSTTLLTTTTTTTTTTTYPTVDTIDNHHYQICLEGGGIEVDGYGTAMIVESCILNRNRNPHLNRDQCTQILCRLFGFIKIIWLPGILDPYDITDGHVDGFLRFVPTEPDDLESVVVMAYNDDDDDNDDNEDHTTDVNSTTTSISLQHQRILQNSTNARNGSFRIVRLPNPSTKSLQRLYYKAYPDFCASYINYYICNHRTLLVPQFNVTPYDENAIRILTETFPNTYTIVPIPIHTGIACGGGGIHCVTLHQPAIIHKTHTGRRSGRG